MYHGSSEETNKKKPIPMGEENVFREKQASKNKEKKKTSWKTRKRDCHWHIKKSAKAKETRCGASFSEGKNDRGAMPVDGTGNQNERRKSEKRMQQEGTKKS